MKLILVYATFAVVAQLANVADAQVDETITPGTSGEAVVIATVNRIKQLESPELEDDKELLRRIALVETRDGTDSHTYRDNYHGGIWQVDEDMFNTTKMIIATKLRVASRIASNFGIIWLSSNWEDLRKPLYSGLAARLFISGIDETIPLASDVEGQAKYWKMYYDLPSGPGTEEEFVEAVTGYPNSCRVTGIDIVFLLDSSGSIGSNGFELIKDFTTDMVRELEIGPSDVQVAVIKYASSVTVEFHLNDYDDKDALLQAIADIQFTGGGTNTHLGLQAVVEEYNSYARPVREGVPRVAFVLTDGRSNDQEATIAAAMELHTTNIETYAIAIGSNVDDDELTAIATRSGNVRTTSLSAVELKELQEFLDREACAANVIAHVGQEFNGTLKHNEVSYFEYDLPEEGMMLKVEVTEGTVVIYISTRVSNPNEALYDYKLVTNTTTDIFIEPPTKRKRRQDDSGSPANKVYVSIEGQSPLNHFVLNTETPFEITFINDSPVVSGNSMTAFINSNKPVSDMQCKMSGTKEVKNCTNGYVQFTDLHVRGIYTLTVDAKTEEGQTATITRQFRIDRAGYCTAHLINNGVSVEGNKVTVEFTSSGDTTSTSCILDPPATKENKFFSCTSPVVMYLSPGAHLFKITPKGCGSQRKAVKVKFEV